MERTLANVPLLQRHVLPSPHPEQHTSPRLWLVVAPHRSCLPPRAVLGRTEWRTAHVPDLAPDVDRIVKTC